MRQIVTLLAKILTIKGIAKLFVGLNMGVSYIDSISFFYQLYELSFKTTGYAILLLTFMFVMYWKKVTEVPIKLSISRYFVILKGLLLIWAVIPIFLNENWELINFSSVENLHTIRCCVEVIKIICIEFVVEILFYIVKSFEDKSSP